MNATEPKQYASESGHWYLPDGTPYYEVPNASKPGEFRPTTLRDAKKVGAVPSVTTVLKIINQPGLRRYFDRMMWEATHTTPRLAGEPDESYFQRCLASADEHSRIAREKGTEIHGAIEVAMQGEPVPSAAPQRPFVDAAWNALNEAGISPAVRLAEMSFASPLGYGGKVDLHGTGFVLDFKTKANWTDSDVKRGLAYDEHLLQLVAYAHGLGLEGARLINVFIATDEPGKYHVHEWPADEHGPAWELFRAILKVWQLKNNYGV